jgi:hypothetical protein
MPLASIQGNTKALRPLAESLQVAIDNGVRRVLAIGEQTTLLGGACGDRWVS